MEPFDAETDDWPLNTTPSADVKFAQLAYLPPRSDANGCAEVKGKERVRDGACLGPNQ